MRLRNFRVVALLVLQLFALTLFTPAQDILHPEYPFRFAALGDNGCGCDGEHDVANKLLAWYKDHKFDTVLMLGDNIYPFKGMRGGNPALFPLAFDQYYKPLTDAGVKFYATLGNHDLETQDGKYEIQDRQRFNILSEKGYYHFSSKQEANGAPLVTFFSMNSNTLLKANGDKAQVEWLSKSLTDSKSIWKIVYFHHPIYAPPGAHGPEVEMREGIEKILTAAGVTIVLAGHDHYYAHIKPQNGIHYFISGGGGHSLKTPKKTDDMITVAKQYHFMYFEAYPEKIDYVVLPTSGAILDQGTIQKPVPKTTS
jgi:Calcineurin-like phosphoesterase